VSSKPYCIDTIPLFPKLGKHLIELAEDLTTEEWNAPTQFPVWRVKDIFSHLLDTALRRLSSQRDRYLPVEKPHISSYAEFIAYITQTADRWASATAHLSPQVLVELMKSAQDQLAQYLGGLDPNARSAVPVSWAGQTESRNWFDTAREYTERWHHQMQIREALRRDSLCTRELYFPVLDTFMEALPHHYRAIHRPDGYVLEIRIDGPAGGVWHLEWQGARRNLLRSGAQRTDGSVAIDQSIAWMVFTRYNETLYHKEMVFTGDKELAQHLLDMRCVMV
jgi:uncharacterized protein (TIGR03083 family)